MTSEDAKNAQRVESSQAFFQTAEESRQEKKKLSVCFTEQQSRNQSERSTNPHETIPNQVWDIRVRENSFDFVDRYVQ